MGCAMSVAAVESFVSADANEVFRTRTVAVAATAASVRQARLIVITFSFVLVCEWLDCISLGLACNSHSQSECCWGYMLSS